MSARHAVVPARIGLYGGSFDPPHQGHRALADCALAQLGLDELRWVVAGRPWQKARELASADDRAAMVSLAMAGDPRQRLERCELERVGPSYTIDTVEQLAQASPGAQWFLILGEDQLANFCTWHRWADLASRVTLAVAARAGCPPQPPQALLATGARLAWLDMPAHAASSSAVRAALQSGQPAALLPLAPTVADYINRRGLYHAAP